MKTITRLLVLMLALACFSACPSAFASEQFLLDDEGKVFVGEKPKRLPNLAEQEAYKYPGEKIALYGPPVLERVHFFEGVVVQRSSEYLIFDPSEGKIKRVKEDAVFKGEKRFLWHLVAVGVILIVMIVGEIFFYKPEVVGHTIFAMFATLITVAYLGKVFLLNESLIVFLLLCQAAISIVMAIVDLSLSTRRRMLIIFCIMSVIILAL